MSRALRLAALSAVAGALALAGSCGGAHSLSEIVALVTSDLPPARMPAVKLSLSHSSDPAAPTLFESDCLCVGDKPGCTALPLALGIVPGKPGVGRFTVRARGYSDLQCQQTLVEQSATVRFVDKQTLSLDLSLLAACTGVVCPAGMTCEDATRQCVDDQRGGLPAFDGGASSDRCSDGGWCAVNPTPTTSQLFAVWAGAANDVWIGGSDGALLHFDGTTWTPAVIDGTTQINAIDGAAPNDLWAVGTNGTILHFDGTTWSAVASPITSDLQTVAATGPGRALSVGAAGVALLLDGGGAHPLVTNVSDDLLSLFVLGPSEALLGGTQLLHLDGTTVTPVLPRPPSRLSGLRATSAKDIWATSTAGLLHFDGSAWQVVMVGSDDQTVALRAFAGRSASDVWCVGQGGVIAHFDGTAWSWRRSPTVNSLATVAAVDDGMIAVGLGGTIVRGSGDALALASGPTSDALLSVWAGAPGDAWAVGQRGAAVHWDGTRWSALSPGEAPLTGVFGTRTGEAWAVDLLGGVFHFIGDHWVKAYTAPHGWLGIGGSAPDDVWAVGTLGQAHHFDGTTWSAVDTGSTTDLVGVAATAKTDAWVAAGDGALLHWDGATFAAMPSGAPGRLNAIAALAGNEVWAVGEQGAALHWDGAAWQPSPTGVTVELRGVVVPALGDAWAVGDHGTALHWDGTTWSAVSTATTEDLYAAAASSPADVWAVGLFGTILHH